jgi:hypothetical protein
MNRLVRGVNATRVLQPQPVGSLSMLTLHSHGLYPASEQSHTTPWRRFSHSSPPATTPSSQSPFDPKHVAVTRSPPPRKRPRKQFVPRKAAVQITENARKFFLALLEHPPRPEICGIMLNYNQSSTGEPRMVFSFTFVTPNDITDDDEPVTLRVDKHGQPLTPMETRNDGERKLYVSQHAFLKVLGTTVEVDKDTMQPILHDVEGNLMDPNA